MRTLKYKYHFFTPQWLYLFEILKVACLLNRKDLELGVSSAREVLRSLPLSKPPRWRASGDLPWRKRSFSPPLPSSSFSSSPSPSSSPAISDPPYPPSPRPSLLPAAPAAGNGLRRSMSTCTTSRLASTSRCSGVEPAIRAESSRGGRARRGSRGSTAWSTGWWRRLCPAGARAGTPRWLGFMMGRLRMSSLCLSSRRSVSILMGIIWPIRTRKLIDNYR